MKGYMITLEDYLAIVEMAKQNGKQPGESIQEELEEYMKKNNKGKVIRDSGSIDSFKDKLKESGLNILDLTKKENEEDK